MKRPKALTREQKECASAHHLKADDWLLLEEWDFYYKIINKLTDRIRFIDKFRKEKRR